MTEQKHQTYTDQMASVIIIIVGFPAILLIFHNLPDGSDSKESACDTGDPDWILGSGRSLGEGNGYPLQYSGLGIPWTEETAVYLGLQRVGHD